MSDSDRHINFKLMRDHILAMQDGKDAKMLETSLIALLHSGLFAFRTSVRMP